MPPTGESPDTTPRGLIIAIVLLFLIIITAGVLFYQSQEQQVADRATSELSSIAQLKVDQIAAWRGERLGDAEVLSQNRILIDGLEEYLSSPDPVNEQKIRNLFGQINTSYHYHNVQLVDREGRVKVSLDRADLAISPELDRQLAESLATRNVTLTDLSPAADDRSPHMYAIAPLVVTDNGKTDTVGAVLLTIDPAMDLYPLIQSWPVPSDTAETLLVEREGDHVLYLNDIRHQQDTALNLTIPLSRTDLPAVQAVLGTTGPFTGRDYRGVEVLSVLEPVPGSPWFMVAKVDSAEAFSDWRTRSGLIIILVAATLAGALVIMGLLWQRRQKYYYRALYAAETGRREEEQRNRERLEILLRLSEMESATEQELADYVLDAGCRLTGSPLAFIGTMTPDESVFDITAWSKSVMKDCSVAASPIHYPIARAGIWAEAVRQRKPQVVNDYPAPLPGKKGLPEGHVPITRFVSMPIFEGQRIVMVCAVANKDTDYTPLDVDNLTLLMQGVWSHLRKRKADEALQKSRQLLSEMEIVGRVGGWEFDVRTNRQVWTDEVYRIHEVDKGFEPDVANGIKFYTPESRPVIEEAVRRAVEDGEPFDVELEILTAKGNRRAVHAIGRSDPANHRVYGFFQDITERKQADEALREKTVDLEAAFEEITASEEELRANYEELARNQQALKVSEHLYRSLFENMLNGFAYCRMIFENGVPVDFTYLTVNEAFGKLTGLQNVEGKNVSAVIPGIREADPRLFEIYGRAASTGIPEQFEIFIESLSMWFSISVYSPERGYFVAVFDVITDRKRAEDALRESEQKFRTMLDWTYDWEYWIRPNRDVIYVSPSAERITGYSPGEFAADKTLLDRIMHPDDRASWEDHVAYHADTSRPEDSGKIEFRIIRKDGTIRWIGHVCRSIYTEDGTWAGTRVSNRDITDRKRAEDALRQSEERFRNLVETTSDIIWEVDENAKYTYISPQVSRVIGYEPAEILGKTPFDFMPPDEAGRIGEIFSAVSASREPFSSLENTILHKDGKPVVVETSGIPFFRADGSFGGYRGIDRDITGRKQAETETARLRRQIEFILGATKTGLDIIDTGFNLRYVDPAWQKIYGDYHGKKCYEYFMGRTNACPGCAIPAALEGKKPVVSEEVLVQEGNRPVQVTTLPFQDENGEWLVAEINVDITERKRAEAEREEISRQRQLALDAARLGWWHYDPVTGIASYDKRYREIFGVTGTTRPNQELLTLLHPDDLPTVWAAVEAALDPTDPKPYEIEYRVNAADGVMRWVWATGIATFEGSGTDRHAISFAGTVEDITERKQAENVITLTNRIYQIAQKEDSLKGFLDSCVRMLKEFSGCEAIGIRLLDADGNIPYQAYCGFPPAFYEKETPLSIKSDECMCIYVIRGEVNPELPVATPGGSFYCNGTTRFLATVSEKEKGRTRNVCNQMGYESVALVPLRTQKGIIGLVQFNDHRENMVPLEMVRTIEEIALPFGEAIRTKQVEEEIRSSRVFLDMVIDMSPFPMWISDRDGTVTRVNRSLCETIRLDADQIIGKYNVLRDTNLENQGVMPEVRAVFDRQKPARFSIPWKAAEAGDVDFAGARDMYIDVSLFPILNARGELTHAVCQWVDITERKVAEDRLRETNEYLQNLLDYANAPIIVWDPAFVITRFNPAFEHLTGRSEQEVLGRHLEILFPEASRATSLEQIKKTLEGERWEVVEIPILHRSGEIRTVLWNSANVVDAHGRIISTIAQGQDITERKRTEEALRESEASYRVLAENLPGIVYRIYLQDNNRMVFFNDQLRVLSGYAPPDLGKGEICSIEPHIHPDDLPLVLAAVGKAVDEAAAFVIEYRFQHKDGSWRFFVERGKVVTGENARPLYIDGVIHDITDSKLIGQQREMLIAELEQKNAELERFSYTVSHDLKSPIITIKGFAGLLEDDARAGDPVQLKKDVQRITEAADTMQELLADVLELSRIGRVISPPEKVPFGSIAREAVDLLAGPLAERGVTVDIAPDLPVVNVDHARIREVMVNLLENAVKFMGSQPAPVIRIGAEPGGATPVFFVQDNGIGIDPRYLERIFNLFERLDMSTHGTGIGLTIVRRIIEVHGGKIRAESEGKGKGTTFRFTLPEAGYSGNPKAEEDGVP